MRYPVSKVFITQGWGVNGDVYAKFGYKGHNGIDLRLFDENGNKSDTCLVFAPHDGVVKERRSDPTGYGNYLKIENDVEGSILAHLKEFSVNINKQVKEGELIGIADNTGWSTGAHLHWGFYRFPRDRQNGYGGTIDPIPFIAQSAMTDNIEDLKRRIEDLEKEVEERKKTEQTLSIEKGEEQAARKRDLQAIAEKLKTSDDLVEILKEIEKLLVAEDGLSQCLNDKQVCSSNYASLSTEYTKTLETLSILCGTSVASSRGVERALQAYAKLHQIEVVGDIKDFKNIIKIGGYVLWQKK